jgi:hypothetical protein
MVVSRKLKMTLLLTQKNDEQFFANCSSFCVRGSIRPAGRENISVKLMIFVSQWAQLKTAVGTRVI